MLSESHQLTAPSVSNVALVVVTFRPSAAFLDHIEAAASQFDKVILVDNSENDRAILGRLDIAKFDIILNDGNAGLGSALNTGALRAMELGFEWVVTLDQDTVLFPDFLSGMIGAWRESSPPLVVLGSNYFNSARSKCRVPASEFALVQQETTVITSGSLMHLATWYSIGMFRADYFIDSIDHEFCLRVRQSHFEVGINRQVAMRQQIGERQDLPFFVARFLPYRHSVWRKYTGARNSIRTVIDYATSEPLWSLKKILGMLFEVLAIVVFEPQKLKRLRAFAVGVMHGCQGKLGAVPTRIMNS